MCCETEAASSELSENLTALAALPFGRKTARYDQVRDGPVVVAAVAVAIVVAIVVVVVVIVAADARSEPMQSRCMCEICWKSARVYCSKRLQVVEGRCWHEHYSCQIELWIDRVWSEMWEKHCPMQQCPALPRRHAFSRALPLSTRPLSSSLGSLLFDLVLERSWVGHDRVFEAAAASRRFADCSLHFAVEVDYEIAAAMQVRAESEALRDTFVHFSDLALSLGSALAFVVEIETAHRS